MKVKNNRVVSIRFTMKNSVGDILEDNMGGPAICYLHGSGSILPAIEGELLGLLPGDQSIVFISKSNGYIGVDDDFYVYVVVDDVREASEEEIKCGIHSQRAESGCSEGSCC